MKTDRPHGPAQLRCLKASDLLPALSAGWSDMRRAPLYSFFFASVYVLMGLAMAWVTYVTATSYWLILAVMAFPLIGSLAALGFYEISRRLEAGETLRFKEILLDVWTEKNGQVPWMAVILVVLLLFWFFLGHMLFALFLGLRPMVNISSSLEVFMTLDGASFLFAGSVVGAVFAGLIFGMTVVGLPMLLDRDVDFMTAGLMSISEVWDAPLPYLIWAAVIALVCFVAMIPAFLGLYIALPLFGHATWHLYRRLQNGFEEDIAQYEALQNE